MLSAKLTRHSSKRYPRVWVKQNGRSVLEFVLVVVIIGTLIMYVIDRVQNILADVERVAVVRVIGSLDSAVNLQAAERVLAQGVDAIKNLEHVNPVNFLSEPLENYIGVRSDLLAAQLPPGSWYFDEDEKMLGYIVKNQDRFETRLSGIPRLRFKVILLYAPMAKPKKPAAVQGIKLQSMDSYRWK